MLFFPGILLPHDWKTNNQSRDVLISGIESDLDMGGV